MDAASQLQHYSSSHSPPSPGTSPPSSPTPQPIMPAKDNPLIHSAPSTTLPEGSWPTPPVVSTSTPTPIPVSDPKYASVNSPNPNRLSIMAPPPTIPPVKSASHNIQLTSNSHHFPFMIVTVLVGVALVGFGGSFLYFKSKGSTPKAMVVPQVTPPVTIAPTSIVTQLTPNANPFAQSGATTLANPFSEDDGGNPFDNVADSGSATKAGYTNPF